MIWRTYNSDIVEKAIFQVKDELKGTPPQHWLNDRRNIALTNSVGDVALFEHRNDGIFTGHYFFHSRGKYAIEAGEEFLKEIFTGPYSVKTVIGMTPHKKKGALWITRRLGFTSYGDEEIDGDMHRIFIMTKRDWTTSQGIN